jgi:hypothetical protein
MLNFNQLKSVFAMTKHIHMLQELAVSYTSKKLGNIYSGYQITEFTQNIEAVSKVFMKDLHSRRGKERGEAKLETA